MNSSEADSLLPSRQSPLSRRWLSPAICLGVLFSAAITFSNPPTSTPQLLSSSPSQTAPLMLSTLPPHRARQQSKVAHPSFPHGLGHTGFISTTNPTSNITNNHFIWYQPCTECADPSAAPLIQWFNGGPGSPDLVGVFNQIGNFYVDKNIEVMERCYSWCKTASCLFIDQPVGTGYSFQDSNETIYTATSREAALQAVDVLEQFLEIFPEHQGNDYFVQGLSYAGHYAPHMGRAVLESGVEVTLKGVMVGDPAINHEREVGTYVDVFKTFGLVDAGEAAVLGRIMEASRDKASVGDCKGAFDDWNKVFNDDGGSSCAPDCEFLFQKWTGSGNTENALVQEQPEEFDYFRTWLKRGDNEEMIHVAGSPMAGDSGAGFIEGGIMYEAMVEVRKKRLATSRSASELLILLLVLRCLRALLTHLQSGDFCENTAVHFAELVKSGVDVLIHAGNLDVLLGPGTVKEGVQSILESIEEGAVAEFEGGEKEIWRVDGEIAGYKKCLRRQGKFCYVVLRNSGHEAPSYMPKNAWALQEEFMGREVEARQCSEKEGGAGPLLDL